MPPKRSSVQSVGWVAALLSGGACSGQDLTGPDRGNPAQYAFAAPVEYACGRWAPSTPSVSLGLFDLVIHRDSAIAFGDPITKSERQRLISAGATIVHAFQVDQVRVIMSPTAVANYGVNWARGVVGNPGTEVWVSIGFRGAPNPQLITVVGGTVLQVLIPTNIIFATVPDEAIPSLRRQSSILWVEGNLMGCTY